MTGFVGPVHVDTDCGVDDALALVLVAQLAELRSVTTTWGNCTAGQAAANARHILQSTRARQVPVIAADTIPPESWSASEVHGEDGLGGVVNLPPDPPQPRRRAAARAIVDFASEVGGNGRLLAIAPLTNIADAVKLDPAAMESLDEVIVMAGHGATPRNRWLDDTGDTNTRYDPDAMASVLTSKMRLTFVGIDQTRRVLLGEYAFGQTELGRHLLSISRHYGEARAEAYGYMSSGSGWRVPAHDATAASVLLDTCLYASVTTPIYVDDLSGNQVVRTTPGDGEHGPRHRSITAGPTIRQVEALIAKALAL